nr:hypothetical protein [Streptomyces sp. GESEQ-4]
MQGVADELGGQRGEQTEGREARGCGGQVPGRVAVVGADALRAVGRPDRRLLDRLGGERDRSDADQQQGAEDQVGQARWRVEVLGEEAITQAAASRRPGAGAR